MSRALAYAAVAHLHNAAIESDQPPPTASLRNKIVDRLLDDWGQNVFGLGTFLSKKLRRLGTQHVRSRRLIYSTLAAMPIGDVLLYQAHGAQIRDFIREKIKSSAPPVTVVAHSLGGIASVDLLAIAPFDKNIRLRLVTFGSQAPLLYELGALTCLRPPASLPEFFPDWLNFYDRNDFLSYVAAPLFGEERVKDIAVESGQSFPESHGAYFQSEALSTAIGNFIES